MPAIDTVRTVFDLFLGRRVSTALDMTMTLRMTKVHRFSDGKSATLDGR